MLLQIALSSASKNDYFTQSILPFISSDSQTRGSFHRALKRLRDLAQQLEVDSASKLLDETLARLASQKLSVAVVGEFKRGKSTFINALLGHEILPTGVVPCSAAPIRVTYGDKPLVRIIFKERELNKCPITQ